jgi:DNA-binding MarR family transcriptional regulator
MLVSLWESDELAAAHELPRTQERTLAVIDAAGHMTASVLGRRLGSGAPSVSRLCGRLESAGLLSRRRASHDRRRVDFALTEAGKRALDRVRRQRLDRMTGMLASLDRPAQVALARGLEGLGDALTRSPGADCPRRPSPGGEQALAEGGEGTGEQA